MIAWITSSGLLIFLSCVFLVLFRVHANKKLDLIDWTLLSVGFFYGPIWALVYYKSSMGFNVHWSEWILDQGSSYYYYVISIFLLIVGLLIGWWSGKILIAIKNIRFSRLNELRQSQFFNKLAWFLLISGITFQYLYAMKYGGYLGVFEIARDLRSGISVGHNKFSFLAPLSSVVLISSYIFWGFYIARKNFPFTMLKFIGLSISISFSFYLLISWLGRMGIVIYVSIFLLSPLVYKYRLYPFKLILSVVVVLSLFIFLIYIISSVLDFRAFEGFSSFIVTEFSFPFVGYFSVLNSEMNPRNFIDYLQAPLYLLPSSFWMTIVQGTSSDVVTELVMGTKKGEGGVTGAMPVDIITLGVLQIPVVGSFFSGAIFGFLLRALTYLSLTILPPGIYATFMTLLIIKVASFNVFYSGPLQIITGNINILVSIIIMLLIFKISKIKCGKL